jgi:hypothetical protein
MSGVRRQEGRWTMVNRKTCHLRVAKQGAGHADKLALTHGEVLAVLDDGGLQALGKRADLGIRAQEERPER